MKTLQDILSLNQSRTNVRMYLFGILLMMVLLTATVSAVDDLSGVPSIVLPTPTPPTVTCEAPSQCLMQSDLSGGIVAYSKTSDVPCGYVTVIDREGSVVSQAYCYVQQPVSAPATAPLDIIPADQQVSGPFTGITSVVVVGPSAPANAAALGAVSAGTTVSETPAGTDVTGDQPVAVINSPQEVPGTRPTFAGELLSDETTRVQILATLQEENPAINTLRGDRDAVGIEYGRKAKLFGVFETRYTETVTVGRNGDIRVDQPWWLTFAIQDKHDQLDPLSLQNTLQGREPGSAAYVKSHTTTI